MEILNFEVLIFWKSILMPRRPRLFHPLCTLLSFCLGYFWWFASFAQILHQALASFGDLLLRRWYIYHVYWYNHNMLPEDRKFNSLFRQSSMLADIWIGFYEGCVSTAPKYTCELHWRCRTMCCCDWTLLRAIQYIVHRLSVHHNNRSFHESLAYSFEIDELDVTKIVFNTRCNTNISKLIGVLPKSQRFLLERHYVQLGCS